MATMASRTIAVSIARPWRQVYDFAADPANMARWASGLARALEPAGDHWVAEGPGGRVEIRFSPMNDYGVLDHRVATEDGEVFSPMRVIENGDGAEVAFTLFRRPGMTDEQFAADSEWIAGDLATLKAILEG